MRSLFVRSFARARMRARLRLYFSVESPPRLNKGEINEITKRAGGSLGSQGGGSALALALRWFDFYLISRSSPSRATMRTRADEG